MKYLIFGLGNSLEKHKNNRHNIGRKFVEENKLGLDLSDACIGGGSFIARYTIDNNIYTAYPEGLMMNDSGVSVNDAIRMLSFLGEDIPVENLILVHDDADVPVGEIKFSKTGSSGRHKGVQSVIDELRTEDFMRVRIGIGRDLKENETIYDYVLSDVPEKQKELYEKAFIKAKEKILGIIKKT